jgi:hypothetical protein
MLHLLIFLKVGEGGHQTLGGPLLLHVRLITVLLLTTRGGNRAGGIAGTERYGARVFTFKIAVKRNSKEFFKRSLYVCVCAALGASIPDREAFQFHFFYLKCSGWQHGTQDALVYVVFLDIFNSVL